MRLLLDAHAFIWWLTADPSLPSAARTMIAAPEGIVLVSAATIWELAIKANLGRLDLGGADLVAEIPANGFAELPVSARHAQAAGALPRHHDDPVDRMLIAQAQLEGLTCITRDPAFAHYDVQTLWA